MQHDAEPVGALLERRQPEGRPRRLDRCLARLMRWAIVASGTRKARAISAVVRPPTARRVSASCDGRRERRVAAQEEQRQRVVVRRARSTSGSAVGARGGDVVLAPAAGAVAAQLVGQPPRRDGDQPRRRVVGPPLRPATAPRRRAAPPAPRPRRRRSGRSGAPARRGPAARACAAGPRCAGAGGHASSGGLVHQRPHLDLAEAGERDPRRDLERPLQALAVDDVEAAQVLLGLDVRTVGDHRARRRRRSPSWPSPGRPRRRRRRTHPTPAARRAARRSRR